MKTYSLLILLLTSVSAYADKFTTGPLIKDYGPHAKVEQELKFDKSTVFKVAFDIAAQGEKDKPNRKFVTPARFLNMHVANGVAATNIDLAVVVHGKATKDLVDSADNPNKALIAELVKHNVKFYVCGQSAAYYEVTNDDLLPGVEMALSAMTAHALLQQNGYTVNPF